MHAPEMLPHRRPKSKEAAETSVQHDPIAAKERPLIFVVDDDDGVREALHTVLSDEGYRVALAANGHEAIRALDAGLVPDLLVLDLRMPIMTGWGVWDHLQLRPRLSTIPVLVFTGTGLSQGAVGAATVLSKHVAVDRFVETVARLLQDD